MAKRRKTTTKKDAFLAAFAELGNVTAAAKAAKVERTHVYVWLRDDADFEKRFADAGEEATENLEKEARRRAVEGTLKPVFHQGVQCGSIREFSDTLLIFLLKGRKPERYRDNVRSEHVGSVGVQHSGAIDVHVLTEQLESKLGPDLESVARNRLGTAVPGLLCANGDGGSALSVPGASARGLNGQKGHGPREGTNGKQSPDH